MGSELLRIAEGFSIVAEGLRGLAKAEGGSKTAEKDTGITQKVEKQESVAEVQQENPATLEGIRALMPFMTLCMRTSINWYNAELFSNPIPPSVVS